jgi:hypothetical protein
VRDESSAVPKFSLRSDRRARIWPSTITSREVVGSVGDEQLGAQDERERDHDPLAHAA